MGTEPIAVGRIIGQPVEFHRGPETQPVLPWYLLLSPASCQPPAISALPPDSDPFLASSVWHAAWRASASGRLVNPDGTALLVLTPHRWIR